MTSIMEKMRLGNSSLQTRDPYHTPGYGGFCPQFKYQLGETFGKTTSKLLQDPNVASSGRHVLASIVPDEKVAGNKDSSRFQLMRTRVQSWGDQKLMEEMVPGYTGFIPKSQHYFGNRYAENCVSAIVDFETDQRANKSKTEDMRRVNAVQSGHPCKSPDLKLPPLKHWRRQTHLKPIAKQPQTYISPHAIQHSMSPYYMSDDNPKKCFMSGYTGFVPHARFIMGHGYPAITHQALNEFSQDQARVKQIQDSPITMEFSGPKGFHTTIIYPVDSGLVPHYTGHIPGQKFRYGETFGNSTQNAMHHPTAQCTF